MTPQPSIPSRGEVIGYRAAMEVACFSTAPLEVTKGNILKSRSKTGKLSTEPIFIPNLPDSVDSLHSCRRRSWFCRSQACQATSSTIPLQESYNHSILPCHDEGCGVLAVSGRTTIPREPAGVSGLPTSDGARAVPTQRRRGAPPVSRELGSGYSARYSRMGR